MKLKQWLPDDILISWPEFEKRLDWEVLEEHCSSEKPFPHGKYHTFRNILDWCVVTNGKRVYAIGWNESPRNGWSFPMKWLKERTPPSLYPAN